VVAAALVFIIVAGPSRPDDDDDDEDGSGDGWGDIILPLPLGKVDLKGSGGRIGGDGTCLDLSETSHYLHLKPTTEIGQDRVVHVMSLSKGSNTPIYGS